MQTRLDEKTMKLVRAAARTDGVSVAAWLRRLILRKLERPDLDDVEKRLDELEKIVGDNLSRF